MTDTDAPMIPVPPPQAPPPERPDRWDMVRFVLFFILFLVLAILILAAIGAVASHGTMPKGTDDLTAEQRSWLLTGITIAIYLSLAPAVWFAVTRRNRNPVRVLAFNPVRWWMVPLGGFGMIVLSIVVGWALHSLTKDAQQQMTEAIQSLAITPSLIIATVIMTAVLAPLAEELFFRGLLFGWLRAHWPFWPTAIVTSALFGLAHGNLAYALLTGILGLFLAYLRERTGSLWTTIGAHAINNAFAVGITLLATQA